MKTLTLILIFVMAIPLQAQHLRNEADSVIGWRDKNVAIIIKHKTFCPYCNEIHLMMYYETFCSIRGGCCNNRHFMNHCDRKNKYFVNLNPNDIYLKGVYWEITPEKENEVSDYKLTKIIHIDSLASRKQIDSYPDGDDWEFWLAEGTEEWVASRSNFQVKRLLDLRWGR